MLLAVDETKRCVVSLDAVATQTLIVSLSTTCTALQALLSGSFLMIPSVVADTNV